MITTERLNIRKPLLVDLGRYQKIRNSSFVLKYNCMKELDSKEALAELQSRLNDEYSFFIEEKTSKEFIGCIFFEEDDIRYNVNSVSLAYFMDEAYQNRGYMKEALNALISNGFSKGIDIFTARVFSPNIYSIKLLLSLGFVEEGKLRYCVKGYNDIIYDDILFSLMREDFIKRNR